MSQNLSKWYSIVDLEVSDDIINKRQETISSIVEKYTIEDLLKILMVFFGKSIDDSLYQRIIEDFKITDPNFSYINNDAEIKVLAGDVIADHIENYKESSSTILALAVITSFFDGAYNKIILPDYFPLISDYVKDQSINERNIKPLNTIKPLKIAKEETLSQPVFEGLLVTVNSIISSANNNVKEIEKKMKAYSEESNILWWIQSNFCKLLELPFKKCNKNALGIIIVKDLSGLTEFELFPPAFEYFLVDLLEKNKVKALDKLLLTELINNIPNKEEFLIKEPLLLELCPLHYAIVKFNEVDDGKSWFSAFRKKTGIEETYKSTHLAFAKQFYFECLLIKNYRKVVL